MMKIINKNVTDIKPYNRNAKKHDSVQINKIAKSIESFGFNQPIVLDKDNVIIVGHGRLEGAKLLGMSEVPCYVVDIDESKAKAYRLADNKLNESDWDMKLVFDELQGLEESDVELTGFDLNLEDFEDIDFDNIKDNADREVRFKDIDVNCPECGNLFKIKI